MSKTSGSRLRIFRLRRPGSKPTEGQGPRELRYAEVMDRKRRRRARLRLLLGLIGIILVVAGLVWISSQLRVKRILCTLDGQVCETALEKAAESLLGSSMFGELQIRHPYLGVNFKRIWPSTVSVRFTKPELLFTFRPTGEGKPYSLSSGGYVVEYLGPETRPIYDQELETKQLSEKVEPRVLNFYQELNKQLEQHPGLAIQEIRVISEDEVILMLDRETRAVAMQEGIGEQLSSLQAIYESPTIAREGKTIDLRFDNPVLK